MRTFFLLLLLGNVGFFAWANFMGEGDTQSDPRPLARQIAPEKLQLVAPSGKPAPQAGAETGAGTSGARIACLEWGGFATSDASKAAEMLAPLGLGTRLSRRQVEESAGWWVFFPPRNRQDAQKKAAELKALGIQDYYVLLDEGPLRFAVSLGVFKTENAANTHLEALRGRGVRTAQVGPRDAQILRTYFQVRQVEDALASTLRELAKSIDGSEIRDCTAPPA